MQRKQNIWPQGRRAGWMHDCKHIGQSGGGNRFVDVLVEGCNIYEVVLAVEAAVIIGWRPSNRLFGSIGRIKIDKKHKVIEVIWIIVYLDVD